jgi:hypothetical protein
MKVETELDGESKQAWRTQSSVPLYAMENIEPHFVDITGFYR